jgi:uncharacterized membrane protein YfcA
MLQDLVFYLIGGAAAGLLAGLFGVGGGTILVPVLLLLFAASGIPSELWMHMAIGTSLAVIVLNAISSMRAHHRRGAVRWDIVWQLTPGVVVGAVLGAWIADRMSSQTLALIFASFLVLVGVQLLTARQPKPHRNVPPTPGVVAAGGIIGTVSALVGIGGGSLTVPFLAWCNVNMANAVATSAAVGLPIAISGAAGFIVTGFGNPQLPDWSVGYVYLPAFAGMAIAGMGFAPLGARLAHALPAARLKQSFGVFLILIAASLFAEVL